MKFMYTLGGSSQPLIREYPIAANTAVKNGEACSLSSGLVVSGGSSKLLGVTVEAHGGTAELFDPRSNGKEIRVCCSPDAVYGSPMTTFTASGGSAVTITTTDTALAAFSSSNALAGCYVMIKSKAASSTNTDSSGTCRRITASSVSSGTLTLTLASGGTPISGDVYYIAPCPGFSKLTLDTAKTGVAFSSSGTLFKCVSNDFATHMTEVVCADTLY